MRRDAERLALQDAVPGTPPSLFLYRWERPTLSLGHGQRLLPDFDPEALARAAVPVVRRPTGGRAILHADEWTWSAVGDLADGRLGGTLGESFERVTTLVRVALAAIGAVPDPPGEAPDGAAGAGALGAACFAAAWGHEIRWRGRKLAGGAQRRTRRSFLHQGTLLVAAAGPSLADFLAASAAERQRLRARLEASTVTLGEILGQPPDFAAFARALEGATRRLAAASRTGAVA
jgi:lipoate-protein ligase A